MTRACLGFLGFLLVALAVVPIAATSSTPHPGEKAIEQVLGAKAAPEAHQGYEAYFKGGDTRKLKQHPNHGLALRAAWEEVRLTLPAKEQQGAARPTAGQLHRFVGFLEGRLRVSPPELWEGAVLDAQAYSRDRHVWFGHPRKEALYHDAGLKMRAPRDTTLQEHDGNVTLTVEGGSARIPASLLEEQKKRGSLVSAALTHKVCYLALHEDCGLAYPLVCVERESGKILWKADVWATHVQGGYTGQHYQLVTVIAQEDRVLVFGQGTGGAYVEGFRADNGKNLFRFSTTY